MWLSCPRLTEIPLLLQASQEETVHSHALDPRARASSYLPGSIMLLPDHFSVWSRNYNLANYLFKQGWGISGLFLPLSRTFMNFPWHLSSFNQYLPNGSRLSLPLLLMLRQILHTQPSQYPGLSGPCPPSSATILLPPPQHCMLMLTARLGQSQDFSTFQLQNQVPHSLIAASVSIL